MGRVEPQEEVPARRLREVLGAAVDEAHLAAAKQSHGVEELRREAGLHESHDHVHVARGVGESRQTRLERDKWPRAFPGRSTTACRGASPEGATGAPRAPVARCYSPISRCILL